jgi:hypothetical protein
MFVELQSSQDPLWFPSQLCQKDTCGAGCLISGELKYSTSITSLASQNFTINDKVVWVFS